jgi:hypothetical protein
VKPIQPVWIAAIAGMLAVSAGLDLWLNGAVHVSALACGWVLALANAAAALRIWRRALGHDLQRFFMWGVGFSGARLLLLLVVIFLAKAFLPIHFASFLLAIGSGYFALLAGECVFLMRQA